MSFAKKAKEILLAGVLFSATFTGSMAGLVQLSKNNAEKALVDKDYKNIAIDDWHFEQKMLEDLNVFRWDFNAVSQKGDEVEGKMTISPFSKKTKDMTFKKK